jgi:hypothetical protein
MGRGFFLSFFFLLNLSFFSSFMYVLRTWTSLLYGSSSHPRCNVVCFTNCVPDGLRDEAPQTTASVKRPLVLAGVKFAFSFFPWCGLNETVSQPFK